MVYKVQNIATIIHAKSFIRQEASIEHILTDSRKITFATTAAFFALNGIRRKGIDFIKEVYERGVRTFIIDSLIDFNNYIDANFLLVDDVLLALQKLAAYHRSQFNIPIIGITGSNGKTIIKEWLNQLLHNDFNIIRSPRSYNSQLGVPLSVLQINQHHTLGIFEAGISTINEMQFLEKIIQPTIGILTNIGDAHSEGFISNIQKQEEKLQLFQHCKELVYCKDSIANTINFPNINTFSWSRKQDADLKIEQEIKSTNATTLNVIYKKNIHQLHIPFTDAASVDNTISCSCLLLILQYSFEKINEQLQQLQPVDMRMNLKKGNNNCYILNDSYSNDIASLRIALDYLQQQAGIHSTTVILSDILQSNINDKTLYQEIAAEIQQRNIHTFIGIGNKLTAYQELFSFIDNKQFYTSTDLFLKNNQTTFKDEYILLKGARKFTLEKINRWLEQKTHQTILEINLSALAQNLKTYQQLLMPSTKTMAMVKAFSYGSGSTEVARVLQFCKVDYLAVAYTDEGVDLRKAGISLPIMVMNVDSNSFDSLIEYNLEPEIYSFNIYNQFNQYLNKEAIINFPVHLKVNTGMNRLGFEAYEASKICTLLVQNKTMVVQSVFSHLTSSDNAAHDSFTQHQQQLFESFYKDAFSILQYDFIKHLANSAGINRHQQLQYDMVRLGIGLYGIDSADRNDIRLENVASLKTTIAQIRKVNAGETIGYNRMGIVHRDSLIATIRIGYADGFSRQLSNGKGKVYINGFLASVIGNVCMDMTMIDVTDINCKEDDEVEIFGKNLSIHQVAKWCNTIPYEIMTTINQRVKRVYVEE